MTPSPVRWLQVNIKKKLSPVCNRLKRGGVQRAKPIKINVMNSVEIVVPVAFFGMIFGIVVLVTYYRNKRMERMALISSGRDASIFKEEDDKAKLSSLKYGIFLVGLAIGFIVGDLMALAGSVTEWIAYISMIFLFGGVSLLVFYLIARKILKRGEQTD
jgi:hypothetical protein